MVQRANIKGISDLQFQATPALFDSHIESFLHCSTQLGDLTRKPSLKNAPVFTPSSSLDTSSFNTPSTLTNLSESQRTSQNNHRPTLDNTSMNITTVPLDLYGVGGWVDETLIPAPSDSWYSCQDRVPFTSAATAHNTSSIQPCKSSDEAVSRPRGDHGNGRQYRYFDRVGPSGKHI